MYRGIKLSASLMCINWLEAKKQLAEIEQGDVDFLHLDVIDGRFAADFTMGSSLINFFRANSKLKSDYHLMVEEPSRLFGAFEISPGDVYAIHQECSRNLHRDIVSVRRMGALAGVALSPGTPFTALEYVLEDVDVVLLMTVDPGYKGQPLIKQTIRKIADLKDLIRKKGLSTTITVDGSVNPKSIPEMVAAGADCLVLGSSGLFRQDVSVPEALRQVRAAIDLGLDMRDGKLKRSINE